MVQLSSARPSEALSVQDAELLIARIRAAIEEINKSSLKAHTPPASDGSVPPIVGQNI